MRPQKATQGTAGGRSAPAGDAMAHDANPTLAAALPVSGAGPSMTHRHPHSVKAPLMCDKQATLC